MGGVRVGKNSVLKFDVLKFDVGDDAGGFSAYVLKEVVGGDIVVAIGSEDFLEIISQFFAGFHDLRDIDRSALSDVRTSNI